MINFKTVSFIFVLIVLQSCKTATVSNFQDHSNVATYNYYYYVIDYGLPNSNYTEIEVTQTDSILKMKSEFQELLSLLKDENMNSEIDTLPKYKLNFISENHKSENIGRISTQVSILKKCNQPINLKPFINGLTQVKSYSDKYLVISGFPIISHGATYMKSSTNQYYFEKIE